MPLRCRGVARDIGAVKHAYPHGEQKQWETLSFARTARDLEAQARQGGNQPDACLGKSTASDESREAQTHRWCTQFELGSEPARAGVSSSGRNDRCRWRSHSATCAFLATPALRTTYAG